VLYFGGGGGGIDVLAGHVRRAPDGLQRAGLEWLYRTWQEPRRMWWRYASTNAVFAGLLGREIVARAVGRRGVRDEAQGGRA
jgi:N-acetylglucosaminyldiphosphoundecaprenol N-acetyl-beta-D-mannosaminyltransferase